ncbi:MAG: hypothetical protein AAFY71_10305 [Bacteroidota bacterium]
MVELPLQYTNELASQIIFISALLGGFSLAVLSSQINLNQENKFRTNMFRSSAIAACLFLISIFSMTKILMMTTEGFPFPVTDANLSSAKIIGILCFVGGIASLIVLISLSGWVKSPKMGRFTTILGIITFILLLMNMVEFG